MSDQEELYTAKLDKLLAEDPEPPEKSLEEHLQTIERLRRELAAG